jgi:DegV family protein with EDD domain
MEESKPFMPRTAIITDTDSSLPPDLAARHGIRQAPILVHIDEDTFTCGTDINDRALFAYVDRVKKLPTTSAPSPAAFAVLYENAFQNGAEGIVCICVSSNVSSTYNSAVTACEQFPGRDIRVIDSNSLSMGQGFMALAAAEAARDGADIEDIRTRAVNTGKRMHIYAVLSTLRYLAMSGRVGKVAAGMADTLNIKPILTVDDGKLVLLERVRTRRKAFERVLDLLRRDIQGTTVERMAVLHVNDRERAIAFQEELRHETGFAGEILLAEFTPGLSVHAGSGVVGVVAQTGR